MPQLRQRRSSLPKAKLASQKGSKEAPNWSLRVSLVNCTAERSGQLLERDTRREQPGLSIPVGDEFHSSQGCLIVVASLVGALRQRDRVARYALERY